MLNQNTYEMLLRNAKAARETDNVPEFLQRLDLCNLLLNAYVVSPDDVKRYIEYYKNIDGNDEENALASLFARYVYSEMKSSSGIINKGVFPFFTLLATAIQSLQTDDRYSSLIFPKQKIKTIQEKIDNAKKQIEDYNTAIEDNRIKMNKAKEEEAKLQALYSEKETEINAYNALVNKNKQLKEMIEKYEVNKKKFPAEKLAEENDRLKAEWEKIKKEFEEDSKSVSCVRSLYRFQRTCAEIQDLGPVLKILVELDEDKKILDQIQADNISPISTEGISSINTEISKYIPQYRSELKKIIESISAYK